MVGVSTISSFFCFSFVKRDIDLIVMCLVAYLCCVGVESPLSMDEVLRKRYREKLEHWEVDLAEHLPPPCYLDQLTLTSAAPTPPMAEGTPVSTMGIPLATRSISTASLLLVLFPVPQRQLKIEKMVSSRTFVACRPRGKLSWP